MTKQEFQKQHGPRWAIIANGPEMTGALLTVNASFFDEILTLSPETMASPAGNIILARLQGRLLHERDLLDLLVISPETNDDLPTATYPDPTDEELEQADQQDQTTGGSLLAEFRSEEALAQATKPPKPKRKKRRKRRRPNAT